MGQQSNAVPGDPQISALFTAIAIEAAAAILKFDCRSVSTHHKADRSPVTEADAAAEAVILRALAAKLPGVPVVAEESAANWRERKPVGAYILVDPLDGTSEFLASRDEYTVNIALMRAGAPVVGVVAAPALGLVWRGAGGTAERLRVAPDGSPHEPVAIRTRGWPSGERVAAVSRSHYEAASADFLERFAPVSTIACGSALKFCQVAEGKADIYPRLAPTSEWDIAAGHALVVAAGGVVTAPDGGKLAYGQDTGGFRVPGFVAWGDATRARSA